MATPIRSYRLEVRGKLGDLAARSFPTMRILHRGGNTVLIGPVRDQAELIEHLEHCSDLGLTLLRVTVVDGDRPGRPRATRRQAAPRGSHSPG